MTRIRSVDGRLCASGGRLRACDCGEQECVCTPVCSFYREGVDGTPTYTRPVVYSPARMLVRAEWGSTTFPQSPNYIYEANSDTAFPFAEPVGLGPQSSCPRTDPLPFLVNEYLFRANNLSRNPPSPPIEGQPPTPPSSAPKPSGIDDIANPAGNRDVFCKTEAEYDPLSGILTYRKTLTIGGQEVSDEDRVVGILTINADCVNETAIGTIAVNGVSQQIPASDIEFKLPTIPGPCRPWLALRQRQNMVVQPFQGDGFATLVVFADTLLNGTARLDIRVGNSDVPSGAGVSEMDPSRPPCGCPDSECDACGEDQSPGSATISGTYRYVVFYPNRLGAGRLDTGSLAGQTVNNSGSVCSSTHGTAFATPISVVRRMGGAEVELIKEIGRTDFESGRQPISLVLRWSRYGTLGNPATAGIWVSSANVVNPLLFGTFGEFRSDGYQNPQLPILGSFSATRSACGNRVTLSTEQREDIAGEPGAYTSISVTCEIEFERLLTLCGGTSRSSRGCSGCRDGGLVGVPA